MPVTSPLRHGLCYRTIVLCPVTLVYCGQMVGWIRISLGREVGLDPSNTELDGDPAALMERGNALPHFSAHVYRTEDAGPYKPRTSRTGQCMNRASAILATSALVYSTHRVLVVWIIVAYFHLCSLLGTLCRHTMLEV